MYPHYHICIWAECGGAAARKCCQALGLLDSPHFTVTALLDAAAMPSVTSQKYASNNSTSTSSSSSDSSDSNDICIYRGHKDGEVLAKALEILWHVLSKPTQSTQSTTESQSQGEGANTTSLRTRTRTATEWECMGTVSVDWRGEFAVMNPKQALRLKPMPTPGSYSQSFFS